MDADILYLPHSPPLLRSHAPSNCSDLDSAALLLHPAPSGWHWYHGMAIMKWHMAFICVCAAAWLRSLMSAWHGCKQKGALSDTGAGDTPWPDSLLVFVPQHTNHCPWDMSWTSLEGSVKAAQQQHEFSANNNYIKAINTQLHSRMNTHSEVYFSTVTAQWRSVITGQGCTDAIIVMNGAQSASLFHSTQVWLRRLCSSVSSADVRFEVVSVNILDMTVRISSAVLPDKSEDILGYWFLLPFVLPLVSSVPLLIFFLIWSLFILFLSRWNQSPPAGGRDPVRGGGWRVSSPPGSRAWSGPRVWRGWRSWPTANPGRGCSRDRKWGRGGTSGGERNLDQTDGFHHVLRGFCGGLGQCVAFPISLLQEWRRWAFRSTVSLMLL